jgi:hypothetical protein
MVTLCKNPPNSLEPKNTSDAFSSSSSSLTSYLTHQTSSHRSLALNLISGEDRAHIPFKVSELKEIKKD